jgi:hypothetical protein
MNTEQIKIRAFTLSEVTEILDQIDLAVFNGDPEKVLELGKKAVMLFEVAKKHLVLTLLEDGKTEAASLEKAEIRLIQEELADVILREYQLASMVKCRLPHIIEA